MNLSHQTTKNQIYSASIITSIIFTLVLGGLQVADAEINTSRGDKPLPPPRIQPINGGVRVGATTTRGEMRPGGPAGATSTKRMVLPPGAIRASSTIDLKALRASTTIAIKGSREEFQKDIQARREALKKQLEARKVEKNEKKQKLDEKKKNVVNSALKNIYDRLQNKIAQLANIDARLNAKVAELKAKGNDTSTTTAFLVSAKVALEKAQIDVDATKALSAEQTATSTSREILKSLVKTAEESIKSAKDAYMKAGMSLKPFMVKNENTIAASSTGASVTSSTTVTTN